jgi:hypothetical protein
MMTMTETESRNQSDFYRGYRDGRNGYAPRSARKWYLHGYRFGQARPARHHTMKTARAIARMQERPNDDLTTV